jgi:hypothetical protein
VSLFWGVVFSAAVLFAGLIVDAGRVLDANGAVFDLAGKAARVGAQQLDTAALRAGRVRLDPAAAEQAAERYLRGHGAEGTARAAGATVTVTAVDRVDYRLLVVTGRDGATVTQTRSATAVTGPVPAGGP